MTDTAPPSPQEQPQHAPDEAWEAARRITRSLNENGPQVTRLIVRLIETMGIEFADDFLQQTLAVEAQGGIWLPNGTRRRTPGGAFLYLARKALNAEQQIAVFGRYRAGEPQDITPQSTELHPRLPRFFKAQRVDIVAALREASGSVFSAKVVLIGRPQSVREQMSAVVLLVRDTPKPHTMPKGVPRPPKSTRAYTVFVGAKQWRKVADALDDPNDELIIEGLPAFDPVRERMAIYTTKITSKAIEKAVRLRQQQPQRDNTVQ